MTRLVGGVNKQVGARSVLYVPMLFDHGMWVLPRVNIPINERFQAPKWISLPSGVRRSDVSLTMSYYIYP